MTDMLGAISDDYQDYCTYCKYKGIIPLKKEGSKKFPISEDVLEWN